MPTEVPILEGPEFREFWELHLSQEAREEVKRAVAAGEALDDLGLASAAVSFARKELAFPKLLTLMLLLGGAGSIAFFIWTLSWPAGANATLYRVLAVTWTMAMLGHLILYLFRRPRFKKAEMANLQKLQTPQ